MSNNDPVIDVSLENVIIEPFPDDMVIDLPEQGPPGPSGLGVFTVAGLPPPNLGARAMVTDATATTFASVAIGGGGNVVPVYGDGAIWHIG